jgi:hypothetical protein
MKRYFYGFKEITEAEAKEIERKNHEYLESGDISNLYNIKFVTVIQERKKAPQCNLTD